MKEYLPREALPRPCVNLNRNLLFDRLTNLQFFSIDSNGLVELPFEICACTKLTEIHAADNQLSSLPLEFGYLTALEKLYLQKNKIKELPEVSLFNDV